MSSSVGSDGIKRGTNYAQRARIAAMRGITGRQLAATATQQARCAQGEHDEAVAKQGRVTILAFGQRVIPGTRYCRYCSVVLDGPGC